LIGFLAVLQTAVFPYQTRRKMKGRREGERKKERERREAGKEEQEGEKETKKEKEERERKKERKKGNRAPDFSISVLGLALAQTSRVKSAIF
jgi:hypothetical protein